MKKTSRAIPLVLVLALLLGLLPASLLPASAADTPVSVNVALNQSVSATSSYIPVEGFFNEAFLVDGQWDTYPGKDGNVRLGWNNDTPNTIFSETDPIDITISLDSTYCVDRIVIKPMQWSNGDNLPRGYELQLSTDGVNWNTVVTETDRSAHAASNTEVQPIEYEIDPTEICFFRFHITKSSTCRDANGSYISAIGEIELYGYDTEPFKEAYVNKYALVMNPGETDRLELTTGRLSVTEGVTYQSSNEAVATVDADGTVHAVALGEAVVTIHDGNSEKDYTVPVTVEDFDVHDKFQIVAFIPYFYAENINPTTFDNLKAGGITNVELNFALDAGAITYENNLKAIHYCAERGLDITISEKSFHGNSWESKTDEQILEYVRRYAHLPSVEAFYITDEPSVATQYARPIALVKSVDPYAVTHMNFCGAYDGIVSPLQEKLVGEYGQSLDYIMYDAYVFRNPVCSESTLYTQLEYNRTIGQRLGVPTATYIQSMGWNGCNRPNADAIRYQVYASLAAGVKQLSYFCWQTPRANAAETYGPAVIDIDGNPTDLFEPVSRINAAVQALGPTLMKLETKAMYHTGTSFGSGFNLLPAGFFLNPTDWNQNLAISYMADTESGQSYAMLVNRDYNQSATVSFTIDAGIRTLSRISPETGEPEALTPNAEGVYTLDLLPGEGALLQTDTDFVFVLKEITNFFFLEKAVESAEAVDLSLYREVGQEDFRQALLEAKEVLADEDATQSAVDDAMKALRRAQTALAPIAADGVNLALNKNVTSNSSYEDGTYFSTAYLTDGEYADMSVTTHQGWSVDPFAALSVDSPVWITVDLKDVYAVTSLMLRPTLYNDGEMTPSDFEIRVSMDNSEWVTVRREAGLVLTEMTDLIYTFAPTEGRYVQLYITRHSAGVDTGTGGALSQIGEIEIFGTEPTTTPGEDETSTDTDPVTTPDTDSDTEPMTESVSSTETQPASGTETETATTSQSGCASALLPLSVLSVLLGAAFLCLCKRRRSVRT